MKRALSFSCALSFLFLAFTLHAQPEGYYQFPDVDAGGIVFAAEGDLWRVGLEGGLARRLTTHLGEESHPTLSPDGKLVAFSASYEGPTELYTMPVTGGLPTRWSYEAGSSIAVGFTPTGKLLYATREYSTLPNYQLVTIDPESRLRERIPLAQASDGTYDAAGRTLYFSRPDFHANNTKRYKGGTARNIWKFSGASEAENLTSDFAGESHSPMWWNGRIYYACDRDGTMNIWSMNEEGSDRRQHTRHSGWDVKDPSIGDGKIVYQLGADIWLYDIRADRSRLVPIQLASDFDQLREKWVDDPMEYLTSAAIDREGKRVVLTSRGRLFAAPVEQGRLVRVSPLEGVRYRDAVFMPEGDRVLALSDESGELEFTLLPADGIGPGTTLTSDSSTVRFEGVPSPDGRWIAYSDKNQDLWILNVETREQRKISSKREGIVDYSWSPDSGWLAYSMAASNTFVQIHLFSVESGESTPVTSDRVNSFSPAWSDDGEFLYFLSDRNLSSVVGSPWGARQPEPFFDKPMQIYILPLEREHRNPFRPLDELMGDQEKKGGKEEEEEEGEDTAPARVIVDLNGIRERNELVPVPAGDYRSLSVHQDTLFWLRSLPGERTRELVGVKIAADDVEVQSILKSVGGYDLSGNGKKLLVRVREELYVVPAEPKPVEKLAEHRVDLSAWKFNVDVREDFRQLFIDAWRLERDYFWDPGMHGVDWDAMREKYLPLVDRVTTRSELSDLIGQLVGELSALHISVRGGDLREGREEIRVPALGARLVRDEAANGYRIDYIYRSDPDYPQERSPLADPYLQVEEGDVIEMINGIDALSVTHPNALLRDQQGKQVLVSLRSGTTGELRKIIVTPTENEWDLRYHDWEYTRREAVEEAGNGEIGYLHLRAMGASNLTEWYRNFYPVFNRKGLIIDVRHNRGGNIDSILLEKLLRQAWFYWKPRVGDPYWNMQYAFRGHMVVLINEMTASDGEAFAEGFRRLGLGKLIGTRTWGGEIWLSSNNLLSDHGIARAPQTGVYGEEGVWLIEGHGVEPDIVVDNLPYETFQGSDAQLERAIEFLEEEIARDPVEVPEPPPYPDKSFDYPQ